jgi:hypothetical protein
VKLQPKAKATYHLLVKVLREESGLDLEKAIAEEERRANDRLAMGTVEGHGGDRKSPDQVRNTKLKDAGTDTRSYVIGHLGWEASADPPDLWARMLLDKVLAGEVSAHAAAIAMRWRKPPIPIVNWSCGGTKPATRIAPRSRST